MLFTVFTAAAGSPTSLLRKMKLQVSFMTSGSRMWSVYHGNHGSGNPPYECSRQKNLFLRILISRKEPSGIYGWSNDHDPCFSICFRIASFMEMEMAQLNDKFRLWHESDWIECTTCGGFQRPLSGPDLTDTKKKTCLYTNPLLVGRTTPNPQTSEKKTAVVLRYLGPAGFITMKPSCIYWKKTLWKTGNARVEKKPGSTTLHTSAVSMVSGEFSRFFHQLYRISSCLHACYTLFNLRLKHLEPPDWFTSQPTTSNNWIFPIGNQAPSTASVRERRIAKTTLTVCATSISKDTHFLRRWLLRFLLWFWGPNWLISLSHHEEFEVSAKQAIRTCRKKTQILGSQLWYVMFIPNREHANGLPIDWFSENHLI